MVKFVPLDSRRKSEDVAEQIRELAISRDLKSSERLPPERELAKLFNVSRTGLREALLLLESQGFIVIRRGRQGGAFVQAMHSRPITGAFNHMLRLGHVSIEQLLDARLGVELMILGFIGTPSRNRCIQRLDANLAEAERLVTDAERPAARVELLANLHEFHKLIAEATNNPVFILAADAIVSIISTHLSVAGHQGCVSLDSVREHRAIAEALKAGKLPAARRALEAHLKADSRRTRALLQNYERSGRKRAATPATTRQRLRA